MYKIYLKNILGVNKKQKKEILNIRNSTYVHSKMYTNHKITCDEHFAWIENLKYNKKKIVFVVTNENKTLGMVSLDNINLKRKILEWSYYLTEKNIYGLGPSLEFSLIDYCINKNFFMQIGCEILETNSKIIKFHKKFFFKENKDVIKYIIKNEKKIKIVSMSLTAKEWKEGRIFIKKKYSKIIDNFDITVDEFNPIN